MLGGGSQNEVSLEHQAALPLSGAAHAAAAAMSAVA